MPTHDCLYTEEAYCVASIMPRSQELTSHNAMKQDKDLIIKQLFVFGIGEADLPDSYLKVFSELYFTNCKNLVLKTCSTCLKANQDTRV